MNFYVAILISKMEENVWHITLYFFKKGKMQLKCKKKICAVYGEGAVTDQMYQKWFVKFRVGDFSLDDDAPWLCGPVEVDSDQIETLIESIQCYTTQEITNILKISISIYLLVKMKNVSFIEKTIWTFGPTQ